MTAAFEWQLKGEAPALPESLKLYNRLSSIGMKIVFLTGRDEFLTNIAARNLKNVGDHSCEKLILR